jgi:hypothetical protein
MKKNNYQKPTMQVVKIQKTALLLNSQDPGSGGGNGPHAPKFYSDFDEEM